MRARVTQCTRLMTSPRRCRPRGCDLYTERARRTVRKISGSESRPENKTLRITDRGILLESKFRLTACSTYPVHLLQSLNEPSQPATYLSSSQKRHHYTPQSTNLNYQLRTGASQALKRCEGNHRIPYLGAWKTP